MKPEHDFRLWNTKVVFLGQLSHQSEALTFTNLFLNFLILNFTVFQDTLCFLACSLTAKLL